MSRRVKGRSISDIARDIAPFLGKDERTTAVYVYRWLKTDRVPSIKSLEAIVKAGYKIEPFVFGMNKWEELKR